jgi:transcriptional antiterminator NusG
MSSFEWYAVHTHSGQEARAQKALQDKIRNFASAEKFGEILVPAESDFADIGLPLPKPSADRRFHPCFLFIQMNLDIADKGASAEMYRMITGTPHVTGFLGGARPTPLKGKGKFGTSVDPE